MSNALSRFLQSVVSTYRTVSSVRWLLLGVLVGLITGVAASLFFLGIEYFKHLLLSEWAGLALPAPAGESMFHGADHAARAAGEAVAHATEHTLHPAQARPWLIPVFTTGVALLTGFLVSRFIPESIHGGTDGTDSMIKAFHRQHGVIRPRVPLIKGLTSILTIASGGSAGREGPISQIGAGIGSYLSDRLGLTAKERRILLLSGAAGGLGAIFRAPMGGALTAIEVIYREDFEAEAVLPAVLSSVVSYSLFTLIYGTEPIFGIPTFSFQSVQELPFYVILALFCSATGWLYIKTFFFIKHSIFENLRARIGIMWTTAVGGLMMGLLGMVYPQVLTGGYGWLELAILGQMALTTMVFIIFAKTVATSLTIGSGMSGGMFAPALFVGGMSGGVVGLLGNKLYPEIVTQPGGYVLVGMAAFFAGVANAPIGPLLMVCELTQGYGLLAPLMLCSALCLVINRNLSLYEYQVDNKFESPAHLQDATINVLENLKVEDYYQKGRVTILEEGTTLKALTDIIAGTNEFHFPVKDGDGVYTGILSIQDVRQLLYEDCLFDLVLVKDLARKPSSLSPSDDLYTALIQFVDTDLSQIPVLAEKEEEEDEDVILGLLNRSDVFEAYTKTIQKIQEG